MINGIWCGLIVIGVIVSMFTGKIQAVTDSAISSAGTAVEISIGLVARNWNKFAAHHAH